MRLVFDDHTITRTSLLLSFLLYTENTSSGLPKDTVPTGDTTLAWEKRQAPMPFTSATTYQAPNSRSKLRPEQGLAWLLQEKNLSQKLYKKQVLCYFVTSILGIVNVAPVFLVTVEVFGCIVATSRDTIDETHGI
nr:hypothetical protein [Tanacetum cinerariifolium]